ncbi:MAG TPA: hypothetical protein VG734_07985 [Lacunisphaera sp.]|nr:hypothetical protein [Lacunisphaera sp.]
MQNNKTGAVALLFMLAGLVCTGAESKSCNCGNVEARITCDEGTAVVSCSEKLFSGRCEKASNGKTADPHRVFFGLVRTIQDVTGSKNSFESTTQELLEAVTEKWGRSAETPFPGSFNMPQYGNHLALTIANQRVVCGIGSTIDDPNLFFRHLNKNWIEIVVRAEKSLDGRGSRLYDLRLSEIIERNLP